MARPDLGEGGSFRPVVDLLVEQIECADYVLLNKVDQLGNAHKQQALEAIMASLNSLAKVGGGCEVVQQTLKHNTHCTHSTYNTLHTTHCLRWFPAASGRSPCKTSLGRAATRSWPSSTPRECTGGRSLQHWYDHA